jgi:TIR domain
MSDSIFISYARLDQDFVLPLAERLKEHGFTVWVDQWNIPLGADWDRVIDEAIRDCNRFLIVLSPAATASEYAGEVRGELRRALEQHKEIVPVLYQPCEIPRQLLNIETFDLTSGLNDAGIESLARRLRGDTSEVPPSNRLKFIQGLYAVPKDARAFEDEFTHAVAVDLSKRLTDAQFDALRELKAKRDRYDLGARGIVRSDVLKRIGGSTLEATRSLDVFIQFGLLALSANPRQRNHSDPGYDYTPLFFGYTNLQSYLGGDTTAEDREYWLSSKGC